jgi:hypothetical protein
MDRRQIGRAYKERRQRGGVYTITNTLSGRYLLGHTPDLASLRNHFRFAVRTNSAVHPTLRADWAALGGAAFRLDVLEELEQGPEQTQADFLADLKALEELCRPNLDPAKAY